MIRVIRIVAPNASLFTGPGTNTYLVVSEHECLIIDPGPVIPAHRSAIEERVAGLQARGVLVTHAHPDHAPAANGLAEALGVPAYGYDTGPDFEPDRRLRDGGIVRFGSSELRAIHTPGHSPDHLCFVADEALFSGDHIMGGGTVVVEDMVSYLESLRRLATESVSEIHPGHGLEERQARKVIEAYLEHRLRRERQVLEAVAGGARTVGEVVRTVYADVEKSLHPLAAQSVLAHARKLAAEGRLDLEEKGSVEAGRLEPSSAEEGPLGG